MIDWYVRHPRLLAHVTAAMVVAAIAFEVADLTHTSGAQRIVAAVVFLLAAAGGFTGLRGSWARRRRAGTLVLDPQAQARVAHRALGPGLLGAVALLILTSADRAPALESATGLFSAALVVRLLGRRPPSEP